MGSNPIGTAIRKDIMKKFIDEMIFFLYVHLYAAPIAFVSLGLIIIMMTIFWIIFNVGV